MEDKANYLIQERNIIKEIDIETFSDSPNEIKKISFVCEQKIITWKPKITKISKIYGLNLKIKKPMMLDEIPTKLKEMGTLIRKNGVVDVLTDYLSKDFEGTMYNFIASDKTFGKWSICYEEKETEDKEPIL